jgi:hypothetical protein
MDDRRASEEVNVTHRCTFCGGPVTGPAGGVGECAYCHARVPIGGAGPMSAPISAPKTFSGGPMSTALAWDAQLGFVAVGGHAPMGEPPRLRAWDLAGKRVLWETLQGQTWLDGLRSNALRIIDRTVYVANERQLVALDLASGARKWGAPLSDSVDGTNEPGGGLSVADPFPPGGRGAILVRTIDNTLAAFDRDTGQPLWSRSFADKRFDLEAASGMSVCLVRYGFPYVKVDIVNPAYAQPIASIGHDHWSTDLGLARLSGRTVVTAVDDMGSDGDEDGLLGFDAVTGQRLFFDRVDDLDQDDVVPCAMGSRIFARAGDGMYVGPAGRTIPSPVPNHAPVAFCPAGPTLGVLLVKSQGTPVRRVIGLDPATLGFRFDAGEAGTEPDGNFSEQIRSDGWSLVFVAGSDLRSVDTSTGRMLWSRAVGRWRGHRFIGGALVAWSDEKIDILAPPTGQPVAQLLNG